MLGQYNQASQQRLGALGNLSSLLGIKGFEPVVSQQQGILGPLIGAAGQLGGSAILSSALGGGA